LIAINVFADEPSLYDTLKQMPSQTDSALNSEVSSDSEVLNDGLNIVKPFDEGTKDYLPRSINVNEELPYRYREVIEDSVYLQAVMLSTIGILTLMPEEITNWNTAKLEEKSLSQRWKEHVSTKPVWDDDSWVINYIGHPIAGAWYYTMARNDGMSIGESAAFSALMSTFFWEYGYEAFSEVPSIQDLIFTPLFGSFFGEGMFILEGKLDNQGGILFGSKTLGNVSYFFLDPLGNIADWMRSTLKSFHVDTNVTMTIQTYPQHYLPLYPYNGLQEDSIQHSERQYGVIIRFQ
jgi:hypothetical protein